MCIKGPNGVAAPTVSTTVSKQDNPTQKNKNSMRQKVISALSCLRPSCMSNPKTIQNTGGNAPQPNEIAAISNIASKENKQGEDLTRIRKLPLTADRKKTNIEFSRNTENKTTDIALKIDMLAVKLKGKKMEMEENPIHSDPKKNAQAPKGYFFEKGNASDRLTLTYLSSGSNKFAFELDNLVVALPRQITDESKNVEDFNKNITQESTALTRIKDWGLRVPEHTVIDLNINGKDSVKTLIIEKLPGILVSNLMYTQDFIYSDVLKEGQLNDKDKAETTLTDLKSIEGVLEEMSKTAEGIWGDFQFFYNPDNGEITIFDPMKKPAKGETSPLPQIKKWINQLATAIKKGQMSTETCAEMKQIIADRNNPNVADVRNAVAQKEHKVEAGSTNNIASAFVDIYGEIAKKKMKSSNITLPL